MKCFKKLFSAALAAVLALTLLAGCSSDALDTKEIVNQLGDFDGVTYQDVGESQAAVLEQMILKSGTKSPYDYLSDRRSDNRAAIRTALNIANDTPDFWFFSVTAISDFTSTRFQEKLGAEIVNQILLHRDSSWQQAVDNYNRQPWTYDYDPQTIEFLDHSTYCSRLTLDQGHHSAQGTVSLKLITVGEKQYLIGVWKISAESIH